MMHNRFTIKLLTVVGLLITLTVGGLPSAKVDAQGGVRLRQPSNGTRRLTAYVDHRSPNYTQDGNVVVYTGEERLNCPDCGEAWTDQGPYCYDGHAGIDYALYLEPVLAAAPGTVTFAGSLGGTAGNAVIIDHGNGYETRCYHLNSFSVNVNDEVTAGQQIAVSGNSGTGMPYHLHFEVRHNGQRTDPFGWRGDSTDPLDEPAICLWGDGQCSEVVVEDESSRFYKYGSGWQWDCRGNGWTMRYVSNERDGTAYTDARWRPDLPHAGPYSVYAFVPAVHATTTNAEYVIHDKDGDHPVPISQLNYSDEWVYLGSYDFWDGILGYVYLNEVTGENDGTTDVCFDSVKFRQFHVYIPAVLKNWVAGCEPHTGYWYPVGTNTCDPAVSNCAQGDGQPDGAWAGSWKTGSHQVEFSPQLVQSNTEVGTYWRTKPGTDGYGHLEMNVQVDGGWEQVHESQYQSTSGRWEDVGIGSYAGEYITGLRFGFYWGSTWLTDHEFEVDGYRMGNFVLW